MDAICKSFQWEGVPFIEKYKRNYNIPAYNASSLLQFEAALTSLANKKSFIYKL